MTVCMMKGRQGTEVLTKCGKTIKSPIHNRAPGWTSHHQDATCPDCRSTMGGTRVG